MTDYNALYNCLKTDFKDFFDLTIIPGQNADGDRSLCGEGKRNITNSYGMIFNHEGSTHSHMFNIGQNDDDYYIRDDFNKFKEKYSLRISNFYNYIKENDEIVLVYHPHNGDENIKEICNILKDRYPDKTFNFITI
uniref:Uncharacterized protein n=1 Tax=viral metagenome TaxID=1070528 RepID=A0A6C0EQ54_9ZZZZ